MMNKYLIFLLTAGFLFTKPITVFAQDSGETTFKTICAACHTIGKGRLVGPDLANVTERMPEDWLIKFIRSSQTVIKSGDKTADSLFQAFNKTIMPDQPTFDDAKIKDILAYIKTASSGGASVTGNTNATQTDNQVVNAKDKLFTKTNLILLAFILFMLGVIIYLGWINRKLTDEIRDVYSSDRAFFKKKK